MSMEKIDKKIEAEKRLHEEMQHRKNVEEEAHELICQCRFEEAVALLAMLDDSVVKELAEIVEADGGVTAKVENEREQRQCEEMEAEGKEDTESREEIMKALEKQLQMLFERSCQTEDTKQLCLLNKEICRTAKFLIKMESSHLV